MPILCRFFVEASGAEEARKRSEAFLSRLRALSPGARVEADGPEPYWKVQGWYKVASELIPPPGADERSLERSLAEGLASGWEWLPDDAAVCSADRGGRIPFPGVRWIELDLA